MPPRTRGSKTVKPFKENIGVIDKPKSKTNVKVTKTRKALADKTNSLSDDNASIETPKKVTKTTVKTRSVVDVTDNLVRPRRERRVPKRFVEIEIPGFPSPNKGSPTSTPKKDAINTSVKRVNDPKNSSNTKTTSIKGSKQTKISNYISSQKKVLKSPVKHNSDSKNNAKLRLEQTKETHTLAPLLKETPIKKALPQLSPNVKKPGKKILEKSFSFRVLEEKKKPSKRDNSHLDIYEFTYDPNEEPPPQKKKRKKAVRKKPAQPKAIVYKNNYDKNVAKALAALKNVVAPKTTAPSAVVKPIEKSLATQNKNVVTNTNNKPIAFSTSKGKAQNKTILKRPDQNHMSVRIEDIAADFEPLPDQLDIDYSPVTSPNREKAPNPSDSSRRRSVGRHIPSCDPLNLQENLSFFDDVPVASSSMNISVRRPDASPWRVEFGQLPIKWQANTYVKTNMTPAVESSFINSDDSKTKKKHIYTNLVPESNETLPEILEKTHSYMKQTSIIDFIKEVVERSAKKKNTKSATPTKSNSIFDVSNISVATYKDVFRTPNRTPRREAPNNFSTPNKETNVLPEFNKNNEDKENTCVKTKKKSKTPTKSAEKDCTFFGFDESEDQENLSPLKPINNPRVRALRPRAKAVLQELNSRTGPTRANLPLAAKTRIAPSSEAVNKVYDNMKSATDAPNFPENNLEITNIEHVSDDEDSQSVHLFEDIELVHHLKPSRKSYGKAKKVTIRQPSSSDSESQIQDKIANESGSSGEDDLADLTFTMPDMEKKKPKKKVQNKKKLLSKKEKAEVEAWAAGFNSMCEDIDEFPLVVE